MTQVMSAVADLTDGDSGAVGAETPLMAAGLDSLGATELSSRLRSATGVGLSATLVFEAPTARAVAAHVVERLGCGGAEGAGGREVVGVRLGAWAVCGGALAACCGRVASGVQPARWVADQVDIPHQHAWLATMLRTRSTAVKQSCQLGEQYWQKNEHSTIVVRLLHGKRLAQEQRLVRVYPWWSMHGSLVQQAAADVYVMCWACASLASAAAGAAAAAACTVVAASAHPLPAFMPSSPNAERTAATSSTPTTPPHRRCMRLQPWSHSRSRCSQRRRWRTQLC